MAVKTKKSGYPRHTNYKKSYVKEIIRLAPRYTMLGIAVKWGVTRQTMDNWANDEDKKDFAWAYERAKDINQWTWEEEGKENLYNKDFNFALWNKLYSIRYLNELRRRADLKNFGKAPIDEKISLLFREFEKGNLTTSQVKEIVDSLRTLYDIEQGAEMQKRLDKLEKKIR